MSNTVRWDMGAAKVIATSKQTIASATTTSFDFGTPDDINLASAASRTAGYDAGDRILIVLTATTGGTTHNLTWVVEDAPDNGSNAIGTTAAADTSLVYGALAEGTSDAYTVIAVKTKPGRPWIRVRATDTGTDSFVCACVVMAIPSGM